MSKPEMWTPDSNTDSQIEYPAMKQAVLGASGTIGSLLVDELLDRDIAVTAIGRNWRTAQFGDSVEYATLDVKNDGELEEATKDIGVLYLVTAIPFQAELWRQEWPVVMRNVISAARANEFKVVFLDNVFPYGLVEGEMTEETPFKPDSVKGEVRAEIADALEAEVERGDVVATVGRAANFYGLHTPISNPFFEGAVNDGAPNWLGSLDTLRTFNFAPDIAKSLAILGNDPRADNEVWHLPADQARRGHDFIALAERILGKSLTPILVSSHDMEVANPDGSMPENYELMYQYERDYVFGSDRFQRVFGQRPTSYEDGFRYVLESLLAEK